MYRGLQANLPSVPWLVLPHPYPHPQPQGPGSLLREERGDRNGEGAFVLGADVPE